MGNKEFIGSKVRFPRTSELGSQLHEIQSYSHLTYTHPELNSIIDFQCKQFNYIGVCLWWSRLSCCYLGTFDYAINTYSLRLD